MMEKEEKKRRRKERKLTLTEHLLCVRVYTKYYKCLTLFNSHNSPVRLILFINPVFRRKVKFREVE